MSAKKQDEPGFASRWSRLKQKAKTGAPELEAEDQAAAAEPEPEQAALDERPDHEVLEELGLPDPDTLKHGDNFAAFMSRVVPSRIRNRALRRLWISDPVLANLDEMIDYGGDFTDAATVIENLQTSYQVGRGFADKLADLAKEDTGVAPKVPAEAPAELPPGVPRGTPPDEPPDAVANDPSQEAVDAGEEGTQENAEESGDQAGLTGPEAPLDGSAEAAGVSGADSGDVPATQTVPEPRMPARRRMRFRVAEE